MKVALQLVVVSTAVLLASPLAAQTTLGSLTFNNAQFGNTVVASDGGTLFAGNWLNTVNANPGLVPGLTQVNFNSGVANVGQASYTMGYGTPILNGAGADFAVIVARFSTDNFFLSFSQDGVSFGAETQILGSAAVTTGQNRAYFYQGNGPYSATLWAHVLNLSDFGIVDGANVTAIRVRATTELDLIRVAGMNAESMSTVPEPSTWALLASGMVGLLATRRIRKRGATA